MFFKCECGQVLNDIAYPNSVEHYLVSSNNREKLEHLVDTEVKNDQIVDMWTEHWEDSGSTPTWRCFVCERLYLNVGTDKEIIVYRPEKKRLSE